MPKPSKFSHTILVTTIEGNEIENCVHVNNPNKAIHWIAKDYRTSHQIKKIELISTYVKNNNGKTI